MRAPLGTAFNRKHLFPALLAIALCACNLYATPIHTGEKIMSELTTTMQPICFGRLVIEIPSMAKIEGGWDQTIDGTKIVSLDTPSPNRKSFDTKVAQRERQLKLSPHDTDGVLFKKGIRLTPDSELFVYRKDKSDNLIYQLDTMFWRPKYEYMFHSRTADEYLAEDIDGMSQLVKSFIPMPTTDLMSIPPGLCIEHGVLSGSNFRGESVALAGLINEYPGVAFSFQTESTSKPPEEPRMIARIERSFGMGDNIGKEITAATKFLRKGKRTLNGQPGEEIVAVMTIDGETSIEANAEFYGEPNSLDKPDIYVSLSDQTHDDNTHKPYSKNLTEKEFLALWDALLNGIKPRPKNQWGADSIKK
ncbi:MAG: hypothetical protein KKH12_10350 [Gammaproteobacteria bacterium]|nr:hypothetical protein [Gammaproteobacteria bacterium]MBU1482061.1 hypothetical protein [Gammaproteobacteria bacterium]